MCFHSSRFAARKGINGELILYDDQDEALWDQQMISEGAWHLKDASVGNTFSKYHIEASIAWWYTIKKDTADKWESILLLYNQLLQLNYTPIAALNRTYAFSKVHGAEKAIAEALKLNLSENAYYFILLGELHRQLDPANARDYFINAIPLLHTEAERDQISRKIQALSISPPPFM